jgi:hypothetical protein
MDIIQRGFIGATGTGTGLAISSLHELETWLRIASLSVGLLIGVITLSGICWRLWNDWKKRH